MRRFACILSVLLFWACADWETDPNPLVFDAFYDLFDSEGVAGTTKEEGGGSTGGSKRVFVTAATTTGAIGNSAAADAVCDGDGNRPTDGATFKALLVYPNGTRRACTTVNCFVSGSGENVDWVLAPSTSYTRTDGATRIFTTNSSGIFVFGTLPNAVADDGESYWTGLDNTWDTPIPGNCMNWTSDSNAFSGKRGNDSALDESAVAVPGTLPCNNVLRLLCVEQ